jgi:hypothetical protein
MFISVLIGAFSFEVDQLLLLSQSASVIFIQMIERKSAPMGTRLSSKSQRRIGAVR